MESAMFVETLDKLTFHMVHPWNPKFYTEPQRWKSKNKNSYEIFNRFIVSELFLNVITPERLIRDIRTSKCQDKRYGEGGAGD
jgi:hypothetical protein